MNVADIMAEGTAAVLFVMFQVINVSFVFKAPYPSPDFTGRSSAELRLLWPNSFQDNPALDETLGYFKGLVRHVTHFSILLKISDYQLPLIRFIYSWKM
jgi:hypothetical protein